MMTPERNKSNTGLPRLAFDAGVAYTGAVALLAVNFFIRILLARALTPDELGLLVTGQMIAQLGQTLAQLIVVDATARFVGLYASNSMGKAKRVLLDALRSNLSAATLAAAVLIAGAGVVADRLYNQQKLSGVLIWFAACIPFGVVAETLAAASRGLGQVWIKVFCLDLGRQLMLVLLIGFLGATALNTLSRVVTMYIVSILASCLLTWISFRRDQRWSAPPENIPRGELTRYSLPLFANAFATWPTTLIPLWLGSMVSPQTVTFFTLSSALAQFIYTPVIAVELALLPVYARHISQHNRAEVQRLYLYTTRWCFLIGSIVFVLLFLFPAVVLTSLYGDEYGEGARILQMLAITIMGATLTGTTNCLLRAFGHTREIFFATLVGGIITLIGTYPAIQLWGTGGAVAVFAATQFLNYLLYVGIIYRRQRIHLLNKSYLKVLCGFAGALALSAWLRGFLPEKLWVALGITAFYTFLLFAMLIAFRAFNRKDAMYFRRILARVQRIPVLTSD